MDPVSIIGQVGFPIGVSIYLLTTFRKQLDDLTASNRTLASAVNALHGVLQNCKGCPLHGTKEMHISQQVIDRIGGGSE